MRAAVVLLLLLALGGCLAPSERTVTSEDGLPVDTDRAEDEYWLVWVHGRESRDRDPGEPVVMCSIAFDHAIDVAAKQLTLDRRYEIPENVTRVVAFDHFGDGDCPIAYVTLLGAANVSQEMGEGGGTLRLEVLDDGGARVDGENVVAAGSRLKIGYEGRDGLRGEIVVEPLGAWPRAGLRVQSEG